eukprot:1273935-Pyramimonas_sp.AAC.2
MPLTSDAFPFCGAQRHVLTGVQTLELMTVVLRGAGKRGFVLADGGPLPRAQRTWHLNWCSGLDNVRRHGDGRAMAKT